MRFYHESDNGSHYVVDKYADPLGDQRRTDVETRREGRTMATKWNVEPPWIAWDTIQAERDNYKVDCADCGKPTASPVYWCQTSGRCPKCHTKRMRED